MTHCRLFEDILFIDAARTTATEMALGQYVTHTGVEGDGVGELHGRF